MKLGRADDLDDPILCQIQIDLCVLQDRADEGRAPGFRKLQVFPCRQSDRDVGRYVAGVNFNLMPTTYFWADVERTSGGVLDEDPENRGIYTQSDSSKKSSRNIWSLAVVSVDQRY